MYLKYIYFMLSIVQIYEHVYWYIARDLLILEFLLNFIWSA